MRIARRWRFIPTWSVARRVAPAVALRPATTGGASGWQSPRPSHCPRGTVIVSRRPRSRVGIEPRPEDELRSPVADDGAVRRDLLDDGVGVHGLPFDIFPAVDEHQALG